jgi:8-hydroxy-5-deazaflavin:NADPH oxidoreductase
MNKKRIGILGSGVVAQVLASGFIKNGYEVMLGTRDVYKLKGWVSENPAARTGNFEEAAKFGELIVLAVKGAAAEPLVKKLSVYIIGKTVIDTTNPIADAPPQNGVLKSFTDINRSLMEILQAAAPQSHFVKAFNIVGNKYMVDPKFPGGKPTMFIAGNNEAARNEVAAILDMFNWEVADMGKAEAARAIESLAVLWCIPGFINNQWTHAFKLLKQ